MAVSVRIEDEAFSDARIDHLAALLNSTRYDALGRMAHLWRQATQEASYWLPEGFVRVIVDPEMLIESRLARREKNGIYVCGSRGRIEWLKKLRKNSRKGGEARRLPKWVPKWVPRTKPDVSPPATATATASVSSPSSASALEAEASLERTKHLRDAEMALGDGHESKAYIQAGDSLEGRGTASASRSPPAATPLPIIEPVVITIPLVGGREHDVRAGSVADWQRSFPAVDVMQALREMREWSLANPTRRKTERGVRAFIVRWLGKESRAGPRPKQHSGAFEEVTRQAMEWAHAADAADE